MRTATAWLLARPPSAASRTRGRLVAAGTAVAGGLALAALAVLRVPTVSRPTEPDEVALPPDPRFSALVTEAGLQPGVVTGLVLLVVPALALVWQALTTGSARRTATLRALRLVGPHPPTCAASPLPTRGCWGSPAGCWPVRSTCRCGSCWAPPSRRPPGCCRHPVRPTS